MGFAASYADVIEWSDVVKLCPKESLDILKKLDEYNIDISDFCGLVHESEPIVPELVNPDINVNELIKLLEALEEGFKLATKVGDSYLTLHVGWHCKESNGDRYDEVDGGFFHVNGVHTYSLAGKQLKDHIERKFYVVLC
jgi:hypothetical protein